MSAEAIGGGDEAPAAAAPPPLCRLCLSARDTSPIFGDDSEDHEAATGRNGDSEGVAARILACVRIQVNRTDALSTFICRKCMKNVDNWHVFKRVCDRSQEKLVSWMNSGERGETSIRQLRVKDEPMSEDEDMTIDASYPGPESIENGARRLQPEGPPILASLGLAPRNEKESDDDDENDDASVHDDLPITAEGSDCRPIPVERLASKDCLVCGRAYRYSHNARRHERTAHNYDRYTNKIEPGSPGSSVAAPSNSFKPNKMRLMPNPMKSKYYSQRQHTSQHNGGGRPEILKSLLTRSNEASESEGNDYSDEPPESPESETEPEYPRVETVLSVPDTYLENSESGAESEEAESGQEEGGAGMRSDVMKIESQSDINRIIGIEEDEDGQRPKVSLAKVVGEEEENKDKGEDGEDEKEHDGENDGDEDRDDDKEDNKEEGLIRVKNENESIPDEMAGQNYEDEEDYEDGSHQEDDEDMHDPIVPIVEINENNDQNDTESEESDEESEQNDLLANRTLNLPSSNKQQVGNNLSITVAQKEFLEKYRDVIEQINMKRCKCCDRVFLRRKAVIQHLQKNGFKIPKHTCYTCVLPFTHIGALLSHMRYNCCKDVWKLIYMEGGIPEDMVADENNPQQDGGGTEEILKVPCKDVLNAKSYVCRLCPAKYQLKQFVMKHILDAHESKATEEAPLTCYHCKYSFNNQQLWRKHLRNCECTMLVECDICSESFLTVEEFNEHATAVHGDMHQQESYPTRVSEVKPPTIRSAAARPTQCSVCDKKLSSYRNLIKHLKAVHREDKPHMCQYCVSKFKHYTDLSQHVFLEHTDPTPNGNCDEDMKEEDEEDEVTYNYSCTDCDSVFATLDEWTDHQISAHNHIAFECDQCTKKFWDEAELEEHKALHYKNQLFKCTHCANCFSSQHKLSEHMTQYHRLSLSIDRSLESQFYCEICIRSFKSRQAFSNHMRIHAKVPTTNRRSGELKMISKGEELPVKIQPQPQPPPLTISNWPKSLQTASKLARQNSHAPYSCDICGKGFLHKKNIWKHKKMLHPDVVNKSGKDGAEQSTSKNASTEEEDYANEDQPNRLSIPQFDSFASMYDQHENSNSESGLPYRCDLCDKRFAVKSSIWKHKRVKHGVLNPAQMESTEMKKVEARIEAVQPEPVRASCTVCKLTFTDKKAYYRHRKFAHKGNSIQTCSICGITLNTSLELYEHLQSVHPKDLLVPNAKQSRPPQKKVTHIEPTNSSDDDDEEEGGDAMRVVQKNRKPPKYSCDICGKGFNDIPTLENHHCIPRMPMSETYDCEICKKSYTSISALKSHRGWHLRSPDGRAAFSNSGLWMPQNKVTNKVSKHEVLDGPMSSSPPPSPPPPPPPPPPAVHKGISPLLKRKLPPDVQVTLLKKKKISEEPMASGSVNIHIKEPTIKAERPPAKKPPPVFCPICSKSFTRKSNLLIHMRKHDTSEISEPPEPEDTDDDDEGDAPLHIAPVKKPPVYRCEICNMEYNSSKALRRHRLKYHEVGGRQQKEAEKRNIHQGIIKEYKCGMCDEEWDTEREALAHPHHRCQKCGLFFSQKAKLEAHTRTRHTEKKPQQQQQHYSQQQPQQPQRKAGVYPCGECDRFYMNKKDLIRHTKMFH